MAYVCERMKSSSGHLQKMNAPRFQDLRLPRTLYVPVMALSTGFRSWDFEVLTQGYWEPNIYMYMYMNTHMHMYIYI